MPFRIFRIEKKTKKNRHTRREVGANGGNSRLVGELSILS